MASASRFSPRPLARPVAAKSKRARILRRAIESLETRTHLTVTLDSNGWTQITPSADSRLIYVSSSQGSDSNTGLSSQAPVATLSRAYSLLRNGYPDWILLNRGDTFSGSFSYFGDSGLSQQEPMVVTDYGDPTLPRPVIDSGANTAFRIGNGVQNLAILDISFTTSTHNPNSPNYNGQGSYGLYDLGSGFNLLVEDCSFSYFINDLTFQGYYGPINNVTLRRNEILDSYDVSGHSEGLYAETTNNLTLYDNVFDHDGWNSQVSGAGATIYNHDCYLHSSDTGCVITDNIFADAGSFGLQARAGGIVENNLFVGDPYGFSFGLVNGATTKAGGASGTVSGNIVMDPRQDPSGWGVGAMFGNLAPGGNTQITDNYFLDGGGTNPAMQFTPGNGVTNPQQEVGLNSVTISDNTTYDWGFGLYVSGSYIPGSTGADALNDVVIANNNFQDNATGRIVSHPERFDPRYESWSGNTYSSTTAAMSSWFSLQGPLISFASWQSDIEPTAQATTIPYVNAGVSIAGYMAAQGLAADIPDFIAGARAQNEQDWNSVFTAEAVNPYIEQGYAVDNTAPTAVAAPPADVTPATSPTTTPLTFTVTYSDSVTLNASSITNTNLIATAPDGSTIPAIETGTTGSGASITATYQITPATGDWATEPAGTFVISVPGGDILNSGGIALPAQPLTSFNVQTDPSVTPATAPPASPDSLTATPAGAAINLAWTDSTGDQSGFVLERALDSGFTQGVQNFPFTAGATSFTDTSVQVGTTYYYQLMASNSFGDSQPTAAASATILPPAPALSSFTLNDGNSQRTAIYSITLAYTQPVTLTASDLSLTQTSGGGTAPGISVASLSGDNKTWVVSWSTALPNNALPDGAYTLTVDNPLITDRFAQPAGASNATYSFVSTVPPTVASVSRHDTSPPHSISVTFSDDVSASLKTSTLSLVNSSNQSISATSFSWDAATLTATWTYSGALPDGSYTATLPASSIYDAEGAHLDGNGDGIAGDNYVYSFTQVKPTLTLSGPANSVVNSSYTLTLGAITDNYSTTPQYLVHWGDGTTSTYTSAGAVTHSYTSTGSKSVVVDVIDANGTHADCASTSVSVNHPTVALSGGTNANPGVAYSLTLGAVTDPGFTVSQYIVHWGDGTTSTYSSGGVETHVYSNAGASSVSDTIAIDLVDNSGAGGAAHTTASASTLAVTVNPYPSIALSAPADANVGGVYMLGLGAITDAGMTPSQITINWGDGSAPQSVAAGTSSVTHTYASITAPGSDQIALALTDNTGSFANVAKASVIVNPAPTDTISGSAAVLPGATYTLNVASATDPGQIVSAYTINWGDGSAPSVVSAPGPVTHVYSAAGDDSISVAVTDATGSYASAGSTSVSVVAPTISVSGASVANAGGTYSLTLGPVTDITNSVTGIRVNWGDGASTTYSASGVVTHTYAIAAAGANQISVDLLAGNLAFDGVATQSITVGVPTLTTGGNTWALVGNTYSLTINPPTDPAGSPTQYSISWGDGTSSQSASPGTFTHTFTAVGSPTIQASFTDSTGTFNASPQSVTVYPVPSVSATGSPDANVNGTYTLSLGVPSDAVSSVSQITVHWGDQTSSTLTGASALAGGPVTHTYTSPGPATITVDLTDSLTTYTSVATVPITVNQPTVGLTGASLAPINHSYTLNIGNVFDPGQTPSNFLVHWGDGTTSAYGSPGAVTHTYGASGPETITVDLTDNTGTFTGVGTLPITVGATPTVSVTGNSQATMGGTYTLSLGYFTDPYGTPSSYAVHWGDGSTSVATQLGAVNHTYTATGVDAITVDAVDPAGSWADVGGTSVAVNPSPTVALSGPSTVQQGTSYFLTFGAVTDVGYLPSSYTIHWGDGQVQQISPGAAAAAPVTHTYTAPFVGSISVDLTDGTETYLAAGTQAVTVLAPPTLALSAPANANAGGVYTLQLPAAVDPYSTPSQYVVHWGDGSSSTYSAPGAIIHTYASVGIATLSVDVVDSVGTWASVASAGLTVNAPPTLALSGAGVARANSSYSLALGAATDPGYTPTGYLVHWGDGSTSSYSAGGVVTHAYSTAGPKTISVDLTDATGTYAGAGTMSITVGSPPTLILTGNSNANPGAAYQLTVNPATDANGVPTSYIVHWGDGSTTTLTKAGAASHIYSASASQTISVDVIDPAGTWAGVATKAVTVNARPTIALAGAASTTINASYALTLGAAADPGYSVSSYIVHWGDGSSSTYTASGVVHHTYSTAGARTITVDLTDSTGTYAAAGSKAITVTASKVMGRYTFYNDSLYTQHQTKALSLDSSAIATDKWALLPGQSASFRNYTSYVNGINGIIVDLSGLPAGAVLTAADFKFRVGNGGSTSSWANGPTPSQILMVAGAGTGGSTRVIITFADRSIVGKWLQVTTLADANTALAANDVFYFGNAPGSTGDSSASAAVTSADVALTTKNISLASVSITNVYDFNRDGIVSTADAQIAKSDETSGTSVLQLIKV